MLTAKLSTYSPEEVDMLIDVLEPTLAAISTHSNTDSCGNGDCNSCKAKHVCYDIAKLYDYLILEAKHGYPHCRK